MNMTEKNGQPSMEEILASIRRIIAEEPANQAHGDFRGGQPIMLKGDGVLDDAGDFDLPAIFRSSSTAASVPERPAPLLGRLTDALRSATTPAQSDASANGNGEELELAEANGAAHEPIQDYSLSSLRPVRSNGHHLDGHREAASSSNGARPMNGSGGSNGHGLNGNGNNGHGLNGHGLNGHAVNGHALNGRGLNGHGHHAEAAATPLTASSSNSGEEPKRVMASFKDTKFMRMTSAPADAAPAPTPAASIEVASAPVPIEMPFVEPVAPAPVFEVEESMPAQAMDLAPDAVEAPMQASVVAIPPPPLPAAAHAGDEGVGSIEDTTADLLRPMLRQWLADNMPRMVEKALHIEIAESVKPVKKP